jgi:hypothetical protein
MAGGGCCSLLAALGICAKRGEERKVSEAAAPFQFDSYGRWVHQYSQTTCHPRAEAVSTVAVSVFKKRAESRQRSSSGREERRWSAAGSAMAAGQRLAELSKDVHPGPWLWLRFGICWKEKINKETTYTIWAHHSMV